MEARDGGSDAADDGGEAEQREEIMGRHRKREGVLFVRNGQTQGTLPKDFFRHESMKLKTLADDLLVFVGDEDGISARICSCHRETV